MIEVNANELPRQLFKMCQNVFDNESDFISEFLPHYQVADSCWYEIKNVSFSGKKCHILLEDAGDSDNTVNEYVDLLDVLFWMEKPSD